MGSRGIGGDAGFDQGHHPPQPCPCASAIDSASAAAAHTASKAARADRGVGVPSFSVLWLIGSYSIPAPCLTLRCNLAFPADVPRGGSGGPGACLRLAGSHSGSESLEGTLCAIMSMLA